MRKLIVFLCVIGLIVSFSSPLMAGGIVNKQNQSADYMRTLTRHAATDYADIAAYNPAGIMKMENGSYGKLDIMYFDKDYANKVPGFGTLDQDEPSICPGAFAVYKEENWAGFFAFTIPAGGGTLDYGDGSARTVGLATQIIAGANAQLALLPVPDPTQFFYNQIDSMDIKAEGCTVYGFTFGASLAINDMWSIAGGVRYSKGARALEGGAKMSAANPFPAPGVNDPINARLKIEQEADGMAGILGVNFAPNDKLNTALTYISNTPMKYKNEVKTDTLGIAPAIGFADGSKTQIDIPALLGVGISYKFLPKLKVDLNYTHYFEGSAKIDTFEDEGDSWDLGISAEYTFSPQWKASLGYLYTDIDLSDDQQINEPEEPKLDANTIGAGAVWSPTPAWAVTFGGAYVMYDDVKDSLDIKYEKTVWNLSVGVQWKFQ